MATIRRKIVSAGSFESVSIVKLNPHKDLCDRAVRLLKTTFGCPVAVKEFVTYCEENPDAFGFRNSGGETFLIEVKVSRADFFADKKKRFRVRPECGVGLYRYYMTPSGLISQDELPEKWGLIEVDAKGRCTIVSGKNPKSWHEESFAFVDRNVKGEMQIIYSLCRRLMQGDDCSKWI